MGLKAMFKNMDSDNSGTITLEELKLGLAKQGTKISEYEVKQIMEAVGPQKQKSFWRIFYMNLGMTQVKKGL